MCRPDTCGSRLRNKANYKRPLMPLVMLLDVREVMIVTRLRRKNRHCKRALMRDKQLIIYAIEEVMQVINRHLTIRKKLYQIVMIYIVNINPVAKNEF
jgi:hypothetical protein